MILKPQLVVNTFAGKDILEGRAYWFLKIAKKWFSFR
jgi:hypothetical protein